jgi:hypothetical protein
LVTVIDLSIRTSGRPRFRVVSDHRPPYRHPLWYKSPKQLSAVPSVECPSDRQLLERSSPDPECPDRNPYCPRATVRFVEACLSVLLRRRDLRVHGRRNVPRRLRREWSLSAYIGPRIRFRGSAVSRFTGVSYLHGRGRCEQTAHRYTAPDESRGKRISLRYWDSHPRTSGSRQSHPASQLG